MSVVNLDVLLREMLGPEQSHRFREVADGIIRDLSAEEVEAMAGAFALDGRKGAHTFLASRLTHGRRFVRIHPQTKRVKQVIEGHTFERDVWYSLPEAFGERLRNEPENDTGKWQALFQVESKPPDLDGAPIIFVL